MWNHFRWSSVLIYDSLLLFLAISPILVAADNSTNASGENILLNCGSSGQATDDDSRIWSGDTGSKYGPSLNGVGYTASQQDSSVPNVPYMTARIFTSPFTYTFNLDPGRKFIHLYFYPSNYTHYDVADSFFSVTSNNHTLLSNFSASLTASAINYDYLTREFSVSVSTGDLTLTFTPSTTNHPNSFAFINGIEIVSTLDVFAIGNPLLVLGGDNTPFSVLDMAVETMYRLNVAVETMFSWREN